MIGLYMVEDNGNSLPFAAQSITNLSAKSSKHIIQGALSYIHKNFTRPLKLEDVAKAVYLNPAYLSHVFKQATGVGFIHYLTNLRMQKAKVLLADPQYTIQEVGERVGYSNYRYFSQTFKKYVGKTPHEFRSRS